MYHSSDQQQEWGACSNQRERVQVDISYKWLKKGLKLSSHVSADCQYHIMHPRNPYSGIYSSEPQCQIVPLSLRYKHKSKVLSQAYIEASFRVNGVLIDSQSMSVKRAVDSVSHAIITRISWPIYEQCWSVENVSSEQ